MINKLNKAERRLTQELVVGVVPVGAVPGQPRAGLCAPLLALIHRGRLVPKVTLLTGLHQQVQ